MRQTIKFKKMYYFIALYSKDKRNKTRIKNTRDDVMRFNFAL